MTNIVKRGNRGRNIYDRRAEPRIGLGLPERRQRILSGHPKRRKGD